MIDTRFIDRLKVLADKERKINKFKRLLRIKGRVTAKGKTKKENIILTIEKDKEEYKFTVLKSHKERYALAEKITIGKNVSIAGIPKFRMVICTRLKVLGRGIAQGQQEKLEKFV